MIAGGPDEKGNFLFLKMITTPFAFLNPGGNADSWGGEKNVYGKEPAFEDAGLRTEEKGPKQTDEKHEKAAGAAVTVTVEELGKTVSLKTDGKGAAHLVIGEDWAEISQEGKGLTLNVDVTFQGKKAASKHSISPEDLEAIFEAALLD
jgi:hypothetical protein